MRARRSGPLPLAHAVAARPSASVEARARGGCSRPAPTLPERGGEAGFTLLEIVVAIGLAALLISFGTTSFISLSKAERRRLEVFERDPITEVVLDQMERELVGTLLVVRPSDVPVEKHPWIFTASSDELQGSEADTVRFVTESPARVAGGPVGGAFRIVTYRAQTGNDGRLNLYRAEQAMSERAALEPPSFEDPPTLQDIGQFSVTVIDDEKGTPGEVWDSTELQADRLPARIELALQLNSPVRDGEGTTTPGRVFRRSIDLPVRPLGGEEEDANCPGPSLAECISRFEEVLSTLGSQAEESIAALVDQIEDPRCFATVAATPTGTALVDELQQLTQLDPREVCQ